MIDNHVSLELLDSYVRIPTVSDDISPRILADVLAFWKNIGLHAELLFPTDQTAEPVVPALFFEIPAAIPDAPTLLLYGHWDVQPTGEVESWKWQGNICAPFVPSYANGQLFCCDISQLFDKTVNIEQVAMIGRGTADNKGQHLANIIGILNAKSRGRLAWNIKVLLDGEEERGSPHLSSIIADYRERLRADVMVGSDGPKTENHPSLILGSRGLLEIDLVCKNDWPYAAHSGNYGNIVPNPVLPLAQLLCELETVAKTFDAQRRDKFASIIEMHRRHFCSDQWYAPFLKCTFNVHSLLSDGASLMQPRTIIPRWARAMVDIRLVPGVEADGMVQSIESHIGRWRETHRDCHVGMTVKQKTEGTFSGPTDVGFSWLRSVFETFWLNEDPLIIPVAGGTLPIDLFTRALDIPSYWLPAANSDNRQHDANEHLLLRYYFKQQALYEELVSTPLDPLA